MSPHECLVIIPDKFGYHANANLLNGHVVTARHVANGRARVIIPSENFDNTVYFLPVDDQDLSISAESVSGNGWHTVTVPIIGMMATFKGLHEHRSFWFTAKIIGIEDKRIIFSPPILGNTSLKLGMSGTAGFSENGFLGVISKERNGGPVVESVFNIWQQSKIFRT
ncbi:MAG TPA: hypothetical protein VLH19_05375 [Patescibacteria group bacterium]|nr:hypothetical protein [Patescibacteria group bacterium]